MYSSGNQGFMNKFVDNILNDASPTIPEFCEARTVIKRGFHQRALPRILQDSLPLDRFLANQATPIS
jgi:hypothetical protein